MTLPRPSVTLACPSDAELVELVEGRLEGPALERMTEHLAGCSACAGFLGGLAPHEARGALPTSGVLDVQVARDILAETTAPGSGDAPAGGSVLGRGATVDRYLVLSLIGRGGMGEVYAAYDPDLDRRVALKLLHTARSAEQARRRLTREARALGKLSHPNVVQVHDVGEHEGDVFVAMELVEGQPLDAWCHGPAKPSWQEVLGAYLDAARGLAAAHEEGIVHRDVKPSNILRGKDGRVRVADFGLAVGRPAGAASTEPPDGDPLRDDADAVEARPLADTIPAAATQAGRGGDALTATGALVGTPLYMAPEQFDGAAVGPAADQHSLCTALYQGLYGALPFEVAEGSDVLAQLIARKKEGPPAAPPPGSPVPAPVHRALVRGLASRPEDRFPSMDALIDAFREAMQPPRRTRLRNAAIGAAALLTAAAVAVGIRGGAFDDPCAHPERQLAGAWDPGVRGRVRAAFLGTGRAHAEDTAARVAAQLDRYGASWTAMRSEVCEASRGGQRREILALRDACLDRRRGQLRALTTLFAASPDPQVLDKAVTATASLPPIAYCADTEALAARIPPPEDPALRARVAALQTKVDEMTALRSAGKYRDASTIGESLLAETEGMGFAPLRAQVQTCMGRLREDMGDYAGAATLLGAGASTAAEGEDDVLAAEAISRLLIVVGHRQQRFEDALP